MYILPSVGAVDSCAGNISTFNSSKKNKKGLHVWHVNDSDATQLKKDLVKSHSTTLISTTAFSITTQQRHIVSLFLPLVI